MGTGRKRSAKDTPKNTHNNALSEISFSPLFLWQLLMRFAEYRMELPIKAVMVFPHGYAYYVCPRCGITLEREFVAYCDRCGQHLDWSGYKKATVVYPGNHKESHT